MWYDINVSEGHAASNFRKSSRISEPTPVVMVFSLVLWALDQILRVIVTVCWLSAVVAPPWGEEEPDKYRGELRLLHVWEELILVLIFS
jgi:hypothetical protein